MTVVDPRRAGRAARNKGARGEVELVKTLQAAGWPDCRRNFGSGARGGADNVYGPTDTCWEIKWVERLNLALAWRQVTKAARPTDTRIVAHRVSNKPWLATLSQRDLWALGDVLPWTVHLGAAAGLYGALGLPVGGVLPFAVAHRLTGEYAATLPLSDLLPLLADRDGVLPALAVPGVSANRARRNEGLRKEAHA